MKIFCNVIINQRNLCFYLFLNLLVFKNVGFKKANFCPGSHSNKFNIAFTFSQKLNRMVMIIHSTGVELLGGFVGLGYCERNQALQHFDFFPDGRYSERHKAGTN